jgi:hypothetical protein
MAEAVLALELASAQAKGSGTPSKKRTGMGKLIDLKDRPK